MTDQAYPTSDAVPIHPCGALARRRTETGREQGYWHMAQRHHVEKFTHQDWTVARREPHSALSQHELVSCTPSTSPRVRARKVPLRALRTPSPRTAGTRTSALVLLEPGEHYPNPAGTLCMHSFDAQRLHPGHSAERPLTTYSMKFARRFIDIRADLDLLPAPASRANFTLAIKDEPGSCHHPQQSIKLIHMLDAVVTAVEERNGAVDGSAVQRHFVAKHGVPIHNRSWIGRISQKRMAQEGRPRSISYYIGGA